MLGKRTQAAFRVNTSIDATRADHASPSDTGTACILLDSHAHRTETPLTLNNHVLPTGCSPPCSCRLSDAVQRRISGFAKLYLTSRCICYYGPTTRRRSCARSFDRGCHSAYEHHYQNGTGCPSGGSDQKGVSASASPASTAGKGTVGVQRGWPGRLIVLYSRNHQQTYVGTK